MSEARPHWPALTVAGHFLSMRPVGDLGEDAFTVDQIRKKFGAGWYREADFIAVEAEREKYRRTLDAVMAIFSDPNESGDSDTMLKIIDIVEKALK